MHELDDAVLQCFLDNQEQLFPEGDVASSLEEADTFLKESLAVVVNSIEEVWDFFDEEGKVANTTINLSCDIKEESNIQNIYFD